MKVYVTMEKRNTIGEDDYDELETTWLDTVWTTQEKAQKRIKVMEDEYITKLVSEICDRACVGRKCDEFCHVKRVIDSVDKSNPNEIVIHEGYQRTRTFCVLERRLDTLLGEGEG